jgi:hypothetical protein
VWLVSPSINAIGNRREHGLPDKGDLPSQVAKEFPVIAIQPTHILIVILVALVLFAPTRIPGLVRGAKNMVSEFRKEVSRNDQKKGTAADTPRKLKS